LTGRTNHRWPDPLAPRPPCPAGPSQLLRVSPPAHPAPVLSPSRFPPPGTLPLTTAPGQLCRGTPSHVPRKSSRPGSRRLHAGHHLAGKRTPSRLIPGLSTGPGSDASPACYDTSTATTHVFLIPAW